MLIPASSWPTSPPSSKRRRDAILSKTRRDDHELERERRAHLRLTAEEIIGQNIRRLIPDRSYRPRRTRSSSSSVRGGYIDHYETERLTKDGRRLDVSLSISPIRNRAGEVIGAAKIVRDITARKRARGSHWPRPRRNSSRSSTSRGSSRGSWTSRATSGRSTSSPSKRLDIRETRCSTGRSGTTPWWRGSTEVQARIRAAIEASRRRRRVSRDIAYWPADGTERIVDFAMHPIRDRRRVGALLHPTGIDITDRVRAEEACAHGKPRSVRSPSASSAHASDGPLDHSRRVFRARRSTRQEATYSRSAATGTTSSCSPTAGSRVTVGDVVGHGLAAAAAMGQLRTALSALARVHGSPGELSMRLDAFVARTRTTDFVTVCLRACSDPETRVFEYASAGHPPILLVSPSGDVRWLDDAGSRPPCSGTDRPARPQGSVDARGRLSLFSTPTASIERRGERLDDGLERWRRRRRRSSALPPEVPERPSRPSAATHAMTTSRSRIRHVPDGAAFRRVFDGRAEELRELRVAMRRG